MHEIRQVAERPAVAMWPAEPLQRTQAHEERDADDDGKYSRGEVEEEAQRKKRNELDDCTGDGPDGSGGDRERVARV